MDRPAPVSATKCAAPENQRAGIACFGRISVMKLHSFEMGYSVKSLVRDCELATRGWDWSKGAYGHALSLTSREDLHPVGRNNKNNIPFTGALKRCDYFNEIFRSLECDKASFRLLRRSTDTSYGWHNDLDKGRNVVRFQIPIIADDAAELVITDYETFDELKGGKKRIQDTGYYERFKELNRGHYRAYRLRPGILYYFNTNKLHDLLNRGAERITLSFDLLVNDWLRHNFPETEEEMR